MKFSKMHGLGNDFIMVTDEAKGTDYNELAKKICARRVGAGADGIIIVLPSDIADLRMRIVNADGSEAEMCGNGIRCFAKYVYENGLLQKEQMEIETLAGIMRPKLTIEDGIVTAVCVDMGKPSYDRKSIPMTGSGSAFNVAVNLSDRQVTVSALLMGVPHAVVPVDDIEEYDTAKVGPELEGHELFPNNINVNFVKIIDEENIYVKTFERGAGFTLACGTGCCACVAALYKQGLVKSQVTVNVAVGQMVIEVLADDTVLMSGPAELSYTAELP